MNVLSDPEKVSQGLLLLSTFVILSWLVNHLLVLAKLSIKTLLYLNKVLSFVQIVGVNFTFYKAEIDIIFIM